MKTGQSRGGKAAGEKKKGEVKKGKRRRGKTGRGKGKRASTREKRGAGQKKLTAAKSNDRAGHADGDTPAPAAE